MIRKHIEKDLEQILNVWYHSSTLAHPFLKLEFVEKVKSDMRNIYIPGSDTWVYEKDSQIVGFISMIENEIGGLFVMPSDIGKGIGTRLVNFIGENHKILEVEVFENNKIGRAFYDKHGFCLVNKFIHPESGESVLRMRKQEI